MNKFNHLAAIVFLGFSVISNLTAGSTDRFEKDCSDNNQFEGALNDITFFDVHNFTKDYQVYSPQEFMLAKELSEYAFVEHFGHLQSFIWDNNEDKNQYLSDWTLYLVEVKNNFGYLPAVMHIILGELSLIASNEQKKQIKQLLGYKRISFTENDVWQFLSGSQTTTPLTMISLKNINQNCTKSNCFLLYAALFKPFIRAVNIRSKTPDFQKTVHSFEKDVKTLKPMVRQHLMHTLNVMAIFEGQLFEHAESTAHSDHLNYVSRYTNCHHLCPEYKALIITGWWKKQGVLIDAIRESIVALKGHNIRTFEWVEDDLEGLIHYRIRHPNATISPLDYRLSLTAEDLVTHYCGLITLGDIVIDDAVIEITRKWEKEGILNDAIAECVKIMGRAQELDKTKPRQPDKVNYHPTGKRARTKG